MTEVSGVTPGQTHGVVCGWEGGGRLRSCTTPLSPALLHAGRACKHAASPSPVGGAAPLATADKPCPCACTHTASRPGVPRSPPVTSSRLLAGTVNDHSESPSFGGSLAGRAGTCKAGGVAPARGSLNHRAPCTQQPIIRLRTRTQTATHARNHQPQVVVMMGAHHVHRDASHSILWGARAAAHCAARTQRTRPHTERGAGGGGASSGALHHHASRHQHAEATP